MTPAPESPAAESQGALVVIDPNGRRIRVPLFPFPFKMGRAPDNHLVLRDSRVSRNHAQIVHADGHCVLEDLGSRHGVWVNGKRLVKPKTLEGSERIEFGVPDGYQIHFTRSGEELQRLLNRPVPADTTGRMGSSNLEKLRAVLEVGRSLQSSFSTDDVLNTVLDAALAVTGAERGFLMLFDEAHELQVRSARAGGGGGLSPRDLPQGDLRVPRRLIQQALESRRDLFSMSFDPTALDERSPGNTIADLELRSVVCVPLVRVNLSGSAATQMLSMARANAGVLYMDSRLTAVDLAGGNRELLQTLAIEASTILENARLIEEERARQHIEEELDVARHIQQSLTPRFLPQEGWFVVCGSSESSHQVGGDYYDVVAIGPDTWSLVVADVSGKGVSSALLASFLQGAFLGASCTTDIPEVLSRINTFLSDRAEHGKYATMFYSKLDSRGPPDLCQRRPLRAFAGARGRTDREAGGDLDAGRDWCPRPLFFWNTAISRPAIGSCCIPTASRKRRTMRASSSDASAFARPCENAGGASCPEMHATIQKAVLDFTAGAEQADDLTLVVVEYRGAERRPMFKARFQARPGTD